MPWQNWVITMTPADWTTGIREGYQTKIVQIGNCTVKIHRPILDDQERARAEEQVRDALKGLIMKGT